MRTRCKPDDVIIGMRHGIVVVQTGLRINESGIVCVMIFRGANRRRTSG